MLPGWYNAWTDIRGLSSITKYNVTPRVTSLRQKIRIWFEFYKLAKSDKSLQADISASKPFYEPWLPVDDVQFDEWWQSHQHLFANEVRLVRSVPRNTAEICVAIPLDQSVASSIERVRSIIEETQTQHKNKPAPYQFTGDVGFQGRKLHEAFMMYQYWFKNGKPAINPQLCEDLYRHFTTRKRSKWAPHMIQHPAELNNRNKPVFSENQVRQVRRALSRAEAVCKEVAQGRFPGNNV